MTRILVIDDEASIRDLLDTVLTRKGHEVILADGGRKGMELFRKKHPQLTILDLLMPDLNGIDVLKSIRAHDEQAHVIILTGYATAEAVAMARTLGVTDVLTKEFSLHELGAAIRRALDETATHPWRNGTRYRHKGVLWDTGKRLDHILDHWVHRHHWSSSFRIQKSKQRDDDTYTGLATGTTEVAALQNAVFAAKHWIDNREEEAGQGTLWDGFIERENEIRHER